MEEDDELDDGDLGAGYYVAHGVLFSRTTGAPVCYRRGSTFYRYEDGEPAFYIHRGHLFAF